MIVIRSILTIFCFFVFGLGGFLLGIFFTLYSFIFRGDNREFFCKIVHYSWRIFVRLMECLRLIKVDKSQIKNTEKVEGTIIVSNHPSLIDIVILISFFPKTLCVVKGDLGHNFFIRKIVKSLYITNNENAEEFLKDTNKALNQGFNIVIFPEGTRTSYKKSPRLQRGFSQVAIRSNASILPIKITNNPKILGKNQRWFLAGSKVCEYKFEPKSFIYPRDFLDKSLHKTAIKITRKTKEELF